MRLRDHIGYDKWQKPSWARGWNAWLGPIHVISGNGHLSIWIGQLVLITIDTLTMTIHVDRHWPRR